MKVRKYDVVPDGGPLFFIVHICPTAEQFKEELRKNELEVYGQELDEKMALAIRGQFTGFIQSCVDGEEEEDTGCFGRMFLNLESVDSEVISHECMHAAFQYGRVLEIDHIGMDGEERLCYMQGQCVKAVTSIIDSIRAGA